MPLPIFRSKAGGQSINGMAALVEGGRVGPVPGFPPAIGINVQINAVALAVSAPPELCIPDMD